MSALQNVTGLLYSYRVAMELDYITIRLIYSEIFPIVRTSQVRYVIASGERGIVFILHDDHEFPLLFSAESSHSRFHILDTKPPRTKNPDSHFHRVVRHHLDGAVVEDFMLIEGERIVEIHLARKDFSGDVKRYRFIAELMGRHSNLILTDENGVVITSDHTYRTKGDKIRDIRPGKIYKAPEIRARIPLKAYPFDDFAKFLQTSEESIPWGKLLLDNLIGATPGFVRFISEKSKISEKLPAKELSDELSSQLHDGYLKAVERFHDGDLFPPFDSLIELDESSEYPVNKGIAKYFASMIEQELEGRRETAWQKTVETKIKTLERLLANLRKDKSRADEADKYRKLGDLIYAFPNAFEGGIREAEVDDIFNPESEQKIKIKLLPGKDAISTAQEYHKRASRMSRGEKEISTRLAQTEKELEILQGILVLPEPLLNVKPDVFAKALDNVRAGRYEKIIRLKQKFSRGESVSDEDEPDDSATDAKGRKTPKIELPRALRGENIHHYRSPEGHDIFVGGNDKANESLMKWGQPDDYWLHVKNITGSHVLIPRRGEAIEFDTILFAAQLAVHHSRAKGSSKVMVDYTLLKYVSTPTGAAPGFVIYKKEKSVRVDSPDEHLIEKRKLK